MFAVKLLNGWEPNDLEQIQCLLGCFPIGSEFEVWMRCVAKMQRLPICCPNRKQTLPVICALER
jgi:hypothetical protein